MNDMLLTDAELTQLTGYRQTAKQLSELHRQGFYRARLSPAGGIILERAHYDAVCAGAQQPQRPRITPPRDTKARHHAAPRLAAQGI